MQIKEEVRKRFLLQRRTLSPEFLEKAGRCVSQTVISLDEFINADTVLCYVSIDSELPTRCIFEHCFKSGKRIAAPVCAGDKLIFRYINSFSDLQKGAFSIPEPSENCRKADISENTLCITPAVCYNVSGYRIGYGKGFYDRFFAENKCVRLGVGFEDFITDFSPDENDVKVNIIVTECKVRRL